MVSAADASSDPTSSIIPHLGPATTPRSFPSPPPTYPVSTLVTDNVDTLVSLSSPIPPWQRARHQSLNPYVSAASSPISASSSIPTFIHPPLIIPDSSSPISPSTRRRTLTGGTTHATSANLPSPPRPPQPLQNIPPSSVYSGYSHYRNQHSAAPLRPDMSDHPASSDARSSASSPQSTGSISPRTHIATETASIDHVTNSPLDNRIYSSPSSSQSQKFQHLPKLGPTRSYSHLNQQQQQQQQQLSQSQVEIQSTSVHQVSPQPLVHVPATIQPLSSPTSPVFSGGVFLGSTSRLVTSPSTLSPYPHKQSSSEPAALSTQSPTSVGSTKIPSGSRIAASDAAHLLALMQQSGGCVEGRLYVRRDREDNWTLTFCKIDPEAGSLIATTPNPSSDIQPIILISDLRGCQISTHHDSIHNSIYMEILPRAIGSRIYIRAESLDIYHRWFAAMLCWPPLSPKGCQNMAIKQQPSDPASGLRRVDGTTPVSSGSAEISTIKIGMMEYLDPASYSPESIGFRGGGVFGRPNIFRSQSYLPPSWLGVSCLLKENGELRVLRDGAATAVVQLSHLSRSAIQRLDSSVLQRDYCIAIYPQYASPATVRLLDRPLYFCVTPRAHYEAWVVLLRAFAVPQLYGPKLISLSSAIPDFQHDVLDHLFRMDRTLSVRISSLHYQILLKQLRPEPGGYYIEIQLDGEVRGRTPVVDDKSPFPACEFIFQDVPDSTSVVTFVLKKRNYPPPAAAPRDKDSRRLFDALSFSSGAGVGGGSNKTKGTVGPKPSNLQSVGGRINGISLVPIDTVVGYCDINLVDDLEASSEGSLSQPKIGANPLFTRHTADRAWMILSAKGLPVAKLIAVLTSEETAMLVSRHYQELSRVLHDFNNRITNDLADLLPMQLRRLSGCLLNIFQVTSSAKDWILSLVEEELDDYEEEMSPLVTRSELGLSDRVPDPDFRQISLRNQGKNATVEANLLFRGNTLLTKSLDLHMNRLGREYLEEVLGPKVRDIIDCDLECEVDPSRIDASRNEGGLILRANRRRLLERTEDIWRGILSSADKCPAELREIFRRISSFAQERYGRFQPSVKYISVSGFLFLRFFVPAVLNPRLFGLVREDPSIQSRRTLTLIGKSLQGLANMTPFGTKEAWMEPMNEFVNKNREIFKRFVEQICSLPPDTYRSQPIEPRYQTPLTIMNRLPAPLAEGFPSLPYLIDTAKSFALLASLWLEHANEVRGKLDEEQVALRKFDTLCQNLSELTQDCIDHAERAERPSHVQTFECGDLIRQLEQVRTEPGYNLAADVEAPSPTQFHPQPHFNHPVHSSSLGTPAQPPKPFVNSTIRRASADIAGFPSSDHTYISQANNLPLLQTHRSGFEIPPIRTGDVPLVASSVDDTARRQAHRRTVFHEYPMTSNQHGQPLYSSHEGLDYTQGGNSDSEGTTALPQIDSLDTKRKKDKKELKKDKKNQDKGREKDKGREREREREPGREPQGRSYSARSEDTPGRRWQPDEGVTRSNGGTATGNSPSPSAGYSSTELVGDKSRLSASVGPGSGYFGGFVPGLSKKKWR